MGDAREQERQEAKDIDFKSTPAVKISHSKLEVLDDTTPEPPKTTYIRRSTSCTNEDGSSSVVGVIVELFMKLQEF